MFALVRAMGKRDGAEREKIKSVNYAAKVLRAEFGPFMMETLS